MKIWPVSNACLQPSSRISAKSSSEISKPSPRTKVERTVSRWHTTRRTGFKINAECSKKNYANCTARSAFFYPACCQYSEQSTVRYRWLKWLIFPGFVFSGVCLTTCNDCVAYFILLFFNLFKGKLLVKCTVLLSCCYCSLCMCCFVCTSQRIKWWWWWQWYNNNKRKY